MTIRLDRGGYKVDYSIAVNIGFENQMIQCRDVLGVTDDNTPMRSERGQGWSYHCESRESLLCLMNISLYFDHFDMAFS